jgi:DNA-binding CsgD family transcriptional regulator
VAAALDDLPSTDRMADFRALAALQRELSDARMLHRQRAFARVQEALARLREVASIDQIMRAIPEEVVRIGFDRVILSRVQDSRWIPQTCIIRGDPEWAEEIVRVGREQEQLLDHMLLESEMVRRRAPMIVHDVQNDPRAHRPIADASFSRSYVTAPLMPEGRVIGFLHADCYTTPRHVDEFDRDVLWMFAEGAGYAFERTVLLERQRDLRDRIKKLTGTIHDMVDAVVDGEVEVARLDRETAAATNFAAATVVVPDSHVLSLLTRREVEIARLMAGGLTNGEMARRLVISEGTVKTHVSHILRKLRASNRAQAVSRFVRLAGQAPPTD